MADPYCISELKESVEKMNAELIQSHTKISEFNAKVMEQAEAAHKEIRKLQEENTQLARDLKESEEKCRTVQEKWELAEQRLAQFSQKPNASLEKSVAQSEKKCRAVQESLDLAEQKLVQFSQKPETAAKECLAQVNVKNDNVLNINSLPNRIITEVFSYLEQNQLGQIARVCRRWNELAKSPDLWKKVNVKIFPSCKSQTSTVKSFINRLPSCVTSIRINFMKYRNEVVSLDFRSLCPKLQQKCAKLEELFVTDFLLPENLPTVIVLCSRFLQNLKNLVIHRCIFTRCLPREEFHGTSKIELLDLSVCIFEYVHGPEFSRMPNLKTLCLYGTEIHSGWFPADTSFLNQLHVLNVGCPFITPISFAEIQNHGANLRELYLCGLKIQDCDLTVNNSAFPHLQVICLSKTRVTCEGVISLIQSCPSLVDVYVDEDVAERFAAHPFVVANRYRSGIVKAIGSNDKGHNHNIDYLPESVHFTLWYDPYLLLDKSNYVFPW